jgi:two-component SAPR family response regulator
MQYLITRRNTVVPRDTLNDALWPGETKPANYSSLKVAAHALRKTLSDDVGRHAEAATVEFQDFGYVLRAPNAWTDIESFEQHTRAGWAAYRREDVELATKEFKAAAALYRGEFLPGEDAPWVVEQQVWFQAAALKVFQRLAGLALAAGNEFEAIEWCRRAVDLDPCNERTYQILMNLHANGGELGMALKWYSLCEWRLREDLGVNVSDATRHTLTRIVHRSQMTSLAG